MIIVCGQCQARYKFDETKLGERPRAKTKCAKCGSSIEIENPHAVPETSADKAGEKTDTRRTARSQEETGSTITGKDLHKMGLLQLAKDKRFSLAVIQGTATGQIFPISKTRTTIGRTGADVNLDDPEASRQHAVVEIYGDHAILRDLGSTNGTFLDTERIEQQVLSNQMEFRIGSHVLMFIITDVE